MEAKFRLYDFMEGKMLIGEYETVADLRKAMKEFMLTPREIAIWWHIASMCATPVKSIGKKCLSISDRHRDKPTNNERRNQ